jgi:hypothetical protein
MVEEEDGNKKKRREVGRVLENERGIEEIRRWERGILGRREGKEERENRRRYNNSNSICVIIYNT